MLNSKNYLALGLMSGTSADGIDLATLITDGRSKIKLGPSGYHPFSKSFKNRIKSVFKLSPKNCTTLFLIFNFFFSYTDELFLNVKCF